MKLGGIKYEKFEITKSHYLLNYSTIFDGCILERRKYVPSKFITKHISKFIPSLRVNEILIFQISSI